MADSNHLSPIQSVSLNLPSDISYSKFREIGQTIAGQVRNVQWLAGDWAAYGFERSKTDSEFAEQFNLDLPTIADDTKAIKEAARVSAKFKPEERDKSLSYKHYAHLATLPHGEAKKLLDKAKRDNIPSRQLRIEALGVKAELGQGTFVDDDPDYKALTSIQHMWNRAPFDVRMQFLELAQEANGGVIDA